MSAAQILKSMKGAPKLDNNTYNRWRIHFEDALSLFDVEEYVLVTKSQLDNREIKPVDKKDLDFHKQDKNIRVAISQLVPDIVFHLVDPTYTAKQCWDNLRQFYQPNLSEDVDELLQQFWGLTVEDDVDVDEFVQKLSEYRGKISLINAQLTPSVTV